MGGNVEMASSGAGSGAAGDTLERVRDIAATIADAAAEAERDRRLPDHLMAALHDAGLFRLLLPAPCGGAEMDPPALFEVMEAVAKLDASTAWCLGQANGCAMSAAYLEPAVADEIWGRDPAAVLAWGPGKAQAVCEGDGYRVTGAWSFASGGRNATWFGGHSTVMEADGKPRRRADGTVAIRTMLFPAAQATMTEMWDVIGLLGTGSDGFTVSDLYVPHDHSFAREDAAERRHDTPLYQFPAVSLFAVAFAAVAVGIARPMLDSFKDLAAAKRPRLTHNVLRDDALVQAEVARSEARLGAARAYLRSEIDDIWRAVMASGRLTVEQRMRIRLASTHAIHEARAVADSAYEMAGASAIFTSGPFERRFRDMHTVAQQLQGRAANFQTVGAFLFGHPPDLTVA